MAWFVGVTLKGGLVETRGEQASLSGRTVPFRPADHVFHTRAAPAGARVGGEPAEHPGACASRVRAHGAGRSGQVRGRAPADGDARSGADRVCASGTCCPSGVCCPSRRRLPRLRLAALSPPTPRVQAFVTPAAPALRDGAVRRASCRGGVQALRAEREDGATEAQVTEAYKTYNMLMKNNNFGKGYWLDDKPFFSNIVEAFERNFGLTCAFSACASRLHTHVLYMTRFALCSHARTRVHACARTHTHSPTHSLTRTHTHTRVSRMPAGKAKSVSLADLEDADAPAGSWARARAHARVFTCACACVCVCVCVCAF